MSGSSASGGLSHAISSGRYSHVEVPEDTGEASVTKLRSAHRRRPSGRLAVRPMQTKRIRGLSQGAPRTKPAKVARTRHSRRRRSLARNSRQTPRARREVRVSSALATPKKDARQADHALQLGRGKRGGEECSSVLTQGKIEARSRVCTLVRAQKMGAFSDERAATLRPQKALHARLWATDSESTSHGHTPSSSIVAPC